MRYSRLFAVGLATAVGLFALAGLSGPLSAQTAAAPQIKPLPSIFKCNGIPLADPFKGKLAGRDIPPGILPVSDPDKANILSSDLPCQEQASPAPVNPDAGEAPGLQNLQSGFDF